MIGLARSRRHRSSRKLPIELKGLRMDGIKRLNVIGYQLYELRHDSLDAGRVSNLVGTAQQDSIQPLVIGTDPQCLSSRPFRIPWTSIRDRKLSQAECEVNDDSLHRGNNAL